MEATFRQSMSWLHTWTGVVLGTLLFAIFWMGTLSVFDREIDRWMMPETRLALPANAVSLDSLRSTAEVLAVGAPQWTVWMPTAREPVIRLFYRGSAGLVQHRIDPHTAAALAEPGTWAGTRFIYPFHYVLHLRLWNIGYWLVGLAGMAMLTLCVSGIVIHRGFFGALFTFRPDRKPRRLLLDLHNVTGVLALPFHFIVTLSGLIIFFSLYFPGVRETVYRGDPTFNREAFGSYARPKLSQPGVPASLDAMAAQARRLWQADAPPGASAMHRGDALRVVHPGDAASYVEFRRSFEDAVTMHLDLLYFDGSTGAFLHRSRTGPVVSVQRFIAGLHFIQFRHWTLRWVYFGLGLTGCVMIATGQLYWLASRRQKHARMASGGVRLVEGLTIGGTTGIIIATLAFFAVNRLLPPGATLLGQDRAALEIGTFYLVWISTFAYAWLSPGRAWIDQCRTVAVLAAAAVALNAATTGDHLLRSLAHRHLWPIAGMDLMMLAGAALAVLAARRLRQRAAASGAPLPIAGPRG